MARPAKEDWAISPKLREALDDIYKDCATNEAEAKILDIIITHFIFSEVLGGGEATERQIAAVTGMSKSGVRKVQDRAMAKMKSGLGKRGIRNCGDVLGDGGGRSNAVSKGNNSVD